MTRIELLYDKTVLEVPLPDGVSVTILMPRVMEAFEDPRSEYFRTLESPVAGPPLKELVESTDGEIVILCSDGTRVDGKERSLIWLIDALNEYGAPDDRITLLMALGTHKPPAVEEIPGILGPVTDRVRVELHDINGPMIDRGTTSLGTHVRVNARLADFDLVLFSSGVTHHYFAGYTGVRKLITPGISSLETIESNHSRVWKDPNTDERELMSASGIARGNPVHDDMLECARLALSDTPAFALACVLSPEKDFAFFAAGEIDAAHHAACMFADSVYSIDVEERAELIIASAGGFPKDLNLIQAHKGMDNAIGGLKPGGTIIYAMGCRDGSGHRAIDELAPLDAVSVRARLVENYEIYGQTAHIMKQKARDYRIICITELDPELVDNLGFIRAESIEKALDLAGRESLATNPIYHLPRADLTVIRPPSSR